MECCQEFRLQKLLADKKSVYFDDDHNSMFIASVKKFDYSLFLDYLYNPSVI